MFSKKKITIAFTEEKCNNCQKIQKRKYCDGDVLFMNSSQCTSCDGQTKIERIFGETEDQ